MYRFLWGDALSRAEPPAGPPKFDLLVADATFPEISVIFGIILELFLIKEIRSDNTTDTTPVSLDSFHFHEDRKIAPR